MPNEITSYPLFEDGDVLYGSELMAIGGLPVFSGTATRDAAFGGANEKVLAEGQACYLSDTNVVQTYSGSAWVQLGGGGLVCVKAETAFTTSSSVTADEVFTSTYTNYLVLINYITSSTDNVHLKLRVGGVSASTAYNYQNVNGQSSTAGAGRETSITSTTIAYASSGDFKSSIRLEIFAPQLAQPTNFISLNSVAYNGSYTTPAAVFFIGNHQTATAYDGMELVNSGTLTGTYAIYGYSKAV